MRGGIILGCLLFASSAFAQQVDLNAKRNGEGFTLDLSVPRNVDFALKLRIPNTPEAIKDAQIFDLTGREIQFRTLLAEDENWILGTHREDINFEILHQPEDESFVILARDEAGDPIDIARDDLFLTDTQFKDQCFDMQAVDGSHLPLNIQIALDVSGSMDTALPQLKSNLSQFLAAAPSQARCQITVFDIETRFMDTSGRVHGHGLEAHICSHYLNGLTQSQLGARQEGTNIVKALSPIYDRSLARPDESHLALIISDGIGENEENSHAFKRLKSDATNAVEATGIYTIVNWLGSYDQNYPLSSLADQSVVGAGQGGIGKAFFEKSLDLIDAQRQLTITECAE